MWPAMGRSAVKEITAVVDDSVESDGDDAEEEEDIERVRQLPRLSCLAAFPHSTSVSMLPGKHYYMAICRLHSRSQLLSA